MVCVSDTCVVHVCVHVLYKSLQVYVHVCTCAYGGQMLSLGLPLSLSACCFESGSFPEPRAPQLGGAAGHQAPGSAGLHSHFHPSARVTSEQCHTWLLCGC